MPDPHNPHDPKSDTQRPEAQQGEGSGKIKRPQQSDATMAEKDMARGSDRHIHPN